MKDQKKEKKTKTLEQESIDEFVEGLANLDMEKMLEPYRDGGTQKNPVRRTWGTLIVWLTKKLRFSSDVAGAGILLLVLELHGGRKFDGNGHFGSPGDQLCQHLRSICIQIQSRRKEEEIFAHIGRKIYSQVESKLMEKMQGLLKPWYKRIFS